MRRIHHQERKLPQTMLMEDTIGGKPLRNSLSNRSEIDNHYHFRGLCRLQTAVRERLGAPERFLEPPVTKELSLAPAGAVLIQCRARPLEGEGEGRGHASDAVKSRSRGRQPHRWSSIHTVIPICVCPELIIKCSFHGEIIPE